MRMLQVVLMTASATIAAGCNSAAKDTPLPPTPVRLAVATAGPAAPSIRTNGLLANKHEMRLAFKVGGVIKRLAVAEGETVRKGETLAEIEQTEVDAQVEQAAQACEKAKRDVARGERLYADKVISLEQLQDLRTQAAMAEAALNSARFNWNYAAIVAPRDGTVLRQLAEERELVAAGAPVLIFGAQDRGFVVRAGLADREIVQVRIGDAVHVTLDALPGAKLEGKVTEIASASDPASGMFDIEVALAAKRLPLKSGLVAKLTVVPASASSGERVYVPIGAIVEGHGRTARLFVIEQDRARRRDIEVAFIEGAIVALASGVDAGEQVITDGALYLEDGERVAIFTPLAAGAQP
jgi:RND family efflux transporter MFP subunit